MMFVVTSLYEATVAGLTPVQLILVGTALEISAFVFEVPTGVVADVFDVIIVSAEVGAAKPSEKIYRIALEQLLVEPNEAVFVDDFIENIEACEKLGMMGIHFTDAESALKQLKAIL